MLVTVNAPDVGPLTFHCHDDHIGRMMQRRGTIYEADLLAHIAQTVPRTGIAIDVGACIGTHSVYFAKLGFEVLAVEPVYENAQLWDQNVIANQVREQCTLYGVAVGKYHSAVTMDKNISNMGMCTIAAIDPYHHIPMMTLDDLCYAEERVALIKIDVEGWEMHVLKGAGETLQRWHPWLYIEVQPANLPEVDGLLSQYGYKRSEGSWAVTKVYEYVC